VWQREGVALSDASPATRSPLRHPARVVLIGFASAIATGTALLLLPIARAGPGGATPMEAAFTATSAVTVTGLGIVDTAGHWSGFGEAVILALIQLGGLGIMTFATLVLVGLSGRVGLRNRLLAQQEVGVLTLGEVRRVVRGVVTLSLAVEALVTLILAGWLVLRYDEPFLEALWLGLFHAVSAFNNAGFALYPDSLIRFVGDPVVNLAILTSLVLGGLGVPVLAEVVRDRLHWSKWTLHTRIVMATTAILIVGGWLVVAAFEWTNSRTLGPMSLPEKGLAALFQSVSPRTAGFNTLDYSVMRESTWLVTIALMFIGAAPASTGGGIKVTTFAVLAYVILAEVRGDPDVNLFQRRLPTAAQRQALAVALIGVGVVFGSTLLLEISGDFGLAATLFEVTSAFATVGLSTGITAGVSSIGKVLLVLIMFAGRVGPLTVATALAVRGRDQRYRFAEERPLLG
jgi:potassium uptake TrkH family protein